HRVADQDDAAARTGDRALQQQEIALDVGADDLEVQRGDLLVADTSGHTGALEHARRRGARTDRARGPVDLVGTVGRRLTLEVVTLHHAGEALALADTRDVDVLAGAQKVD